MSSSDRYLGAWELVPELSLYEAGQPPASGRYTIELREDGKLMLKVQWQQATGDAPRETAFGGAPDGSPQHLPGMPGSFSLTRLDAYTLDSSAFSDGRRVAYARRVASHDGALLSVLQEQVAPDGKRTRNFQVYRRAQSV